MATCRTCAYLRKCIEKATKEGYEHNVDFDASSGCPNFGFKSNTNADSIRVMSDEKLAEAFFNLCEKLNDGTMNDLSDLYCDGKNGCIDKDGNITCTRDMEKACVLRWLQQPV